MKKSTIVFVLPNLKIGGAQRVFVNYIRTLNANKHDIYLILINENGPFIDLIPSNVDIIYLNQKRTRSSYLKLLKEIKRIEPELVVCTTNYLNILILMISYFLKEKINICLYEPSMPSAQIRNRHFPKYYFWLIKLLYRKADFIIAQSEEMKDEIHKYFSSPKNEIIVTINPLDEALIHSQLVNQSNPYNQEKINLIVSGRISEEKGQDVLIRAFKKVIDIDNNYRLNILGAVGDQNYYKKVKELIINLNLEDHIKILGFMANPYPFYKHADLLVLPSRWEGLPNVVLEALFLQTPVVVTNCIPYFEKLLNKGNSGYIVDVDDSDGMAEAIINYKNLKVEKGTVPKVNMENIFKRMISYE